MMDYADSTRFYSVLCSTRMQEILHRQIWPCHCVAIRDNMCPHQMARRQCPSLIGKTRITSYPSAVTQYTGMVGYRLHRAVQSVVSNANTLPKH